LEVAYASPFSTMGVSASATFSPVVSKSAVVEGAIDQQLDGQEILSCGSPRLGSRNGESHRSSRVHDSVALSQRLHGSRAGGDLANHQILQHTGLVRPDAPCLLLVAHQQLHVMTRCEQRPDSVTTDEAGSAGDENPQGLVPPLP
jgi:hypothetical protein